MQTWGARGTVAAVGVAAVIAGIGGAAVHAATASGPGFGGPVFGGPGHGGPGFGGPGPDRASHGAVGVDALHGEYVVEAGAGRFVTRVSQVGELTAASPASVTVRSADGFSAQYVLPPGAPLPAATVGDQVTVQARRDGAATVIQSIAGTGGG